MSLIGMGPREPEIPRGAVTASRALAGRRILASHGKILLWVFATTLFFSALLLFSVQPMFGKLILPRLGGAPSVWAVSMCFFQAVLLAGYGYAFALNRWVRDGLARISHRIECIGAANQRKSLCSNNLSPTHGAPRCRQTVAQISLNLHPWKAAKW